MEHLIPLFGTILSLSIPIVAIIMVFLTEMKKRRLHTQLRLSIVEHSTDPELVDKLLEERTPRRNTKFVTLRFGCALIGLSLGGLTASLLGYHFKDYQNLIALCLGLGVGFLTAFAIEYFINSRHPEDEAQQAA